MMKKKTTHINSFEFKLILQMIRIHFLEENVEMSKNLRIFHEIEIDF